MHFTNLEREHIFGIAKHAQKIQNWVKLWEWALSSDGLLVYYRKVTHASRGRNDQLSLHRNLIMWT